MWWVLIDKYQGVVLFMGLGLGPGRRLQELGLNVYERPKITTRTYNSCLPVPFAYHEMNMYNEYINSVTTQQLLYEKKAMRIMLGLWLCHRPKVCAPILNVQWSIHYKPWNSCNVWKSSLATTEISKLNLTPSQDTAAWHGLLKNAVNRPLIPLPVHSSSLFD